MKKNIIFLLLISLLVHQSCSSLLQLSKNIIPKVTISQPSSQSKIQVQIGGGKLPSFGVSHTLHSFKGCDIEVSKFNKDGKFGGFTDSFKSELSDMISQIATVNTPEAAALKTRLTNSLLAINKILNLINQFPKKQDDFKPLLQKQVNRFLEDLDDIQDLMTKQTNVNVVGNNNAVYGSTGYIEGSGSLIVGNQNSIIGDSNVVVGNKTIVGGTSNVVVGNSNVAVGKNNNVSANNAIVFNNNDTIDKSNTLTVGNNTIDLQKLNGGKSTGYLVRN